MIKILRLIFFSIFLNGLFLSFLLALLILIYPYYSPYLRIAIEEKLSQQLEHPVRFETFNFAFIDKHLTLQMSEVRFPTPNTQAIDLHIKKLNVQVDLVRSLRAKALQFSKIQIDIQQLTLFQVEADYFVFPFFAAQGKKANDFERQNKTKWLTWLQQQPFEVTLAQVSFWQGEGEKLKHIQSIALNWRMTTPQYNQKLSAAPFHIYIHPNESENGTLTAHIPFITMSSLVKGLQFFLKNQIDAGELSLLTETQGYVQQLVFTYQSFKKWSLDFELRNISTRATEQWPALDGLNANVRLYPTGGELQLLHSDLRWQPQALYKNTIELKRLHGIVRWQRLNNKDWRISTVNLQAYLADQYPVWLHGKLTFIKQKINSQLSLQIPQLPLNQVHRYIPEQAIPETAKWLKSALIGGYLNDIEIRLMGAMENWFASEKAGFNAHGKITQGKLYYHPDWPLLNDISADIHIVGKKLQVEAQKTRLLKRSHSSYVKAIIPDLSAKMPILSVQTDIDSDMVDGIEFIRLSPVKKVINPEQDLPKMSGKIALKLNLIIPLDNEQEGDVQGEIEFKQVDLYEPKLNLKLEQLIGTVHFDSERLQADLQGEWAKQAVKMQLMSALNEEQAPVKVTLSGQADVAFLERQRQHFAPTLNQIALSDYLSGEMQWQLEVAIPNRKQRLKNQANTQLRFNSDLKGLAILLPAPLAKKTAQSRPLMIQVTLPESLIADPVLFSLNYNQEIALSLHIEPEKPIKGLLQLGTAAIVQSMTLSQLKGWTIMGHLEEFDPLAWYETIKKFNLKQNNAQPLPYLEIDIAVDRVPFTALPLSPLQLALQHENNHWQLQIDSTGIKGEIDYIAPHTLNAKLKKLHLFNLNNAQEKKPKSQAKKSNQLHLLEPAQIPNIEMAIADVMIDQYHLGNLTLKTQYDSVSKINYHGAIHHEYLTVVTQGHWMGEKNQQQTTLTMSGISDNVGLGLQQLNVSHPPIADGRLEWLLDVIWPGNPSAFRLNQVVGTLSLLLTEGHLVALEPGTVGRMISLFDLQALPRRLSMDFRDVFDAGLGFAIIAGDFAIMDGDAKTDNLIVQSSAARVLITGKTNFLNKTYQQIATVTPHISNTLPIAGVIAGGLTAGAVTLIVQHLLQEQIEKAIQYRYQITGDWSEPIVERLIHESLP